MTKIQESPLDLSVKKKSGIIGIKKNSVAKKRSGNKKKSGSPHQVKRLQTNRPVADKVQALDILRTGKTKAYVSRHLGIAESTIRGWVKEETKLRALREEEEEAIRNALAANSNSVENRQAGQAVYRLGEPPDILFPLPPKNIKSQEELNKWMEERRLEIQTMLHSMNLYEVDILRKRLGITLPTDD